MTVDAARSTTVSATRSISPSSVPASGGTVKVTVNIVGSYGVGSVVETLPPAEGFEYVSGSVVPSEYSADSIRAEGDVPPCRRRQSFTYDVTVPASPGEHTFSGALTYGLDKTVAQIGETTVTVDAAPSTTVSATRSISPSSVPASGGTVKVTVNIVGSYGVGSVRRNAAACGGVRVRVRVGGAVRYSADSIRAEGDVPPCRRAVLHLRRDRTGLARGAHVLRCVDLWP